SSIPTHLDPLDDVPQPNTVRTAKDQDVFKSRLVGESDFRNFGRHIDQLPESRTPLANTSIDSKSTGLAKSVPAKDQLEGDFTIHTQFGFRTDKKGQQAAQTSDIPRLTLPVGASGSQEFETTALAIEGVQTGTYYGSVKWGWTKKAGETEPKPINFTK